MIRRSITTFIAAAIFCVLPLVAQQPAGGGAAVPEKAQKEFNKGNEALAKEDTAKALDRFQKAVNIHPQYAEALNAIGSVHMRQGENEKATEYFNKAVAADANYIPAHLNLVRAAAAQRDFAAADTHLQKASALGAHNADVLAVTVQLRLLQNRASDAVAAVRQLHTVSHKQYADLHLLAASILEAQGKKTEAATEYRAFLQERPDSEDASRAKEGLARLNMPNQ